MLFVKYKQGRAINLANVVNIEQLDKGCKIYFIDGWVKEFPEINYEDVIKRMSKAYPIIDLIR